MRDSVVVVETPLTSHDQLPALVWYLVLNIWTLGSLLTSPT